MLYVCPENKDKSSRCDGEVGGRQRADFSHLLSFLQSDLLTGSLLFLLLILHVREKVKSSQWMKQRGLLMEEVLSFRKRAELLGEIGLERTLVSSCALAKLSTAMAKNTFSRVSEHRVKGSPASGPLFVQEYTACIGKELS